MPSTTVQLNTRIDKNLKRGGDAVFARCGLSSSEVVRAVWQYAVDHQDAPDFIKDAKRPPDRCDQALARARAGCGLALAVAREKCAFADSSTAVPADADRRSEREGMYDDLLARMEERCW